MSTGLSEKLFETIIQKIKVENHELVVIDNSSDLEDFTEDYVNQQNTICKKTIPSNNYQNNEKVSSVTESNSQKPDSENKCLKRRSRVKKTRLHSSNNEILKTIPSRTSKTIHKCSVRCNWCNYPEEFDSSLAREKSTMQHGTEIITEIDSFLDYHNKTPVDEGSRKKNKQKFKTYPCAVSNCIQPGVYPLSIRECLMMEGVFSKFNFSFDIEPYHFSFLENVLKLSKLIVCDEHMRMMRVITLCQLCSNSVEKLNFEDCKMYDHWNSILLHNNIPLTLQPGMFICLTCKSCIADNDFLSPMNLKCLQENVEKKNSERIKTFGIVNHRSSITNKSKPMDLKVTFSEPVVTSTCVFERSISEANKKKVIKKSISKPNNRVNKIMNLLTNENLEPAMENSDVSESNDEVKIKPEEEINPFAFNTILDLKIEEESDEKPYLELDHDEDIKIKPDVDLLKYNSLENVPETLAINDNALKDEDFNSIYGQDLMVNNENGENEEIHHYNIKCKDELEEINNYLPYYTNIFSDHGNSSLNEKTNLLPIVTDVVSRQDLVVDDKDNICIDLTEDLSDSDDKSHQSNCDLLISKESIVKSNISVPLFKPGPVKPSNISKKDIQNPRFENTHECHKSIVNYYGNMSNSYDSPCYPISDNTSQNNNTNKITVSDYIDVENVSSERDEKLPMSLINSEEEELNILSSDEAELSPVNEPNKLGLRIENTTSLNPNFARPLRIERTLQKISFFKTSSKLRKRKNNSDRYDDGSESETLFDVKSKTQPLKVNSKYFDMLRKTNTSSDMTKKMKGFWIECLKVLTDQINDPNNPNKEILNNIAKKMDGNVNILKYLIENQRKLYDGKLIVSENADPEVAEYFKEYLKSLKNIEDLSDVDILMPSLSQSPLSKISSTNVNSLAVNIISTTSNSISTPKDIVNTTYNLSNRCNNLDKVASKTSIPISSTRILNHSSSDSQKTTITNTNDNLYSPYKYTQCIKLLDTPKGIVNTAYNLSNRCNNLDKVASKTSIPISSTRILNHSSSDSQKTTITNPNDNLYPPYKYTQCIKLPDTPKGIVNTAYNLSNRCNNLDKVTSKTSIPISSTRILNHSSSDSHETTITNPNDNLYPPYKYTQYIKLPDTPCQSISQSRPFIGKPRLLINQTRSPGVINSPPGLLINQQRPIISRQPIVHPTFQLPTAVRSKPLSFSQNNPLYPNINTQAVRNVSNISSKYSILRKSHKYVRKQ